MSHSTEPQATSTESVDTAENRELLTSIVTVSRSIFGAAASSVFLFDQESNELVFKAVSGKGEGLLVGTRFPADRGVAGWVVATGQAVTTADLTANPVFARDLAERTGYVPDSIMAVPVVHRHDTLGVLQVLDPHPQSRSSIADLDLLAMFADQAALSLHILLRDDAARAAGDAGFAVLGRISTLLNGMDAEQRGRGVQMVESLHGILAGMAR
ncbi:GAF domain-containing protein [Micromonospora carbonacea]|uniref:GAF domain-containing protein n=1 Tax=Micromonospora carbonacea TaxID=47853 RepID=A0A1C4VGX1_9ACTN|nr:GAF domain-containing protein [Micromonospora carbonacea]SCE83029.1 GAF domain-containing protein [Micromonospora carbonacea]